MRTLVAFPQTGIFGQQVALAFAEVEALEELLTTFAYRPHSAIGTALERIPGHIAARVRRELYRREISLIPDGMVKTRARYEICRVLAQKIGCSASTVDRIWELLSRDFTLTAARRLSELAAAGRCHSVYAYEFTALEAFKAAEKAGVAKILDFPSLNGREFEELRRSQRSAYPELAREDDAHFDALFEERQALRDAEMARADVIITNSSITRASHVRAGAPPDRTFAVPLGAPEPVARVRPHSKTGPLKVVWAGTFSLRKGAHLFLNAWRRFARGHAIASVFGGMDLPRRLFDPQPAGLEFHGSVPRARLFEAFDEADVLIFPTLSDGFGMVITEAFSRGLPVISTDSAGASDFVRDKQNGLLIAAGNEDAIVGALEWCASNREALASMRDAARMTAASWQWSDYRRALRASVALGLRRAGYEPGFGGDEKGTDPSPASLS